MRATMVAAIDQKIAHAGSAHLAEVDLLRVGRHGSARGCARPRLTGKPLQTAVDGAPGTIEAALRLDWLQVQAARRARRTLRPTS